MYMYMYEQAHTCMALIEVGIYHIHRCIYTMYMYICIMEAIQIKGTDR